MRIVDFHNHYYPPVYVEALKTSASVVKVTYDKDGNPCVHYPGTTTSSCRGIATSRTGRACSTSWA